MQKLIKKNLIIWITVLVLINLPTAFLLLKSRCFSHLAVWKVVESGRQNDFYWHPEDAPGYFYFEEGQIFKDKNLPAIKDENGDLKIMLDTAKYKMDFNSGNKKTSLPVKWDSPEGLLRQVENGASANCFYRAILYSAYLSGLGVKSRLWALENERFDAVAHTVNEVYIKNLRKWVFIDVTFGFFVTSDGNPLSFLEFREKLLNGGTRSLLVHSIYNTEETQFQIPIFYNRMVKCVFLRTMNNFTGKYNTRYSALHALYRYIDRFPNSARLGLDYLLKGETFIHYIDKDSKSLFIVIVTAKLLFFLFIFSIGFLAISSVIIFLRFVKYG